MVKSFGSEGVVFDGLTLDPRLDHTIFRLPISTAVCKTLESWVDAEQASPEEDLDSN